MAITYPRPLPIEDFEQQRFDLQFLVATTPLRIGRTQAIELGTARWVANYTTRPLYDHELGAVEVWWQTLKGGIKTFYAFDARRQYPIEYGDEILDLTRAGGGAFDGTAQVTGIGAYTISMGDLPAGLKLATGDYVGLVQDANRGLHRIVEDATADGTGAVTVTVEPGVLTNVYSALAVANLIKPVCIMVPDPASWQGPVAAEPQQITFGGMQKVI